MKVALLVAALCVAAVLARPVLDDSIIRRINSDETSTWTAAANERFAGMEWEEVKAMMSLRPTTVKRFGNQTFALDADAIPATFDASQQWPGCVHPVRDQAQCGSCWAFGATESLSDRFCIASKSAVNVILSPEYLVACDTTDFGCNGGYLDNAWAWLKSHGCPTETCYPYTSGGGSVPACKAKCNDGSAMKMYKAASVIDLSGNVAAIQTEIMTNGPVEAAFDVYQDFFSYSSGVYSHKTGGLAGGHAIKVIGWGELNNVAYWICYNSWGTSWGMKGLFFIKRGSDECGIEDNIVTGLPALSGETAPLKRIF